MGRMSRYLKQIYCNDNVNENRMREFLKAIWQFCSYVFGPQLRLKEEFISTAKPMSTVMEEE